LLKEITKSQTTANKAFDKLTTQQHTHQSALTDHLQQIKEETVQLVKNNGGPGEGGNENNSQMLAEIKTSLAANLGIKAVSNATAEAAPAEPAPAAAPADDSASAARTEALTQ
jgi:hypothetical protein